MVHRRLREIYGVSGAIAGGGFGDAGTSPAGLPAADCPRRSSSRFAKSRIWFLSASGRELSPSHSCLSSSAAKRPASPNRPLVVSLGSICRIRPRAIRTTGRRAFPARESSLRKASISARQPLLLAIQLRCHFRVDQAGLEDWRRHPGVTRALDALECIFLTSVSAIVLPSTSRNFCKSVPHQAASSERHVDPPARCRLFALQLRHISIRSPATCHRVLHDPQIRALELGSLKSAPWSWAPRKFAPWSWAHLKFAPWSWAYLQIRALSWASAKFAPWRLATPNSRPGAGLPSNPRPGAGRPQIRALELGSSQIRALELGELQIRALELASRKSAPGQERPNKRRAPQAAPA